MGPAEGESLQQGSHDILPIVRLEQRTHRQRGHDRWYGQALLRPRAFAGRSQLRRHCLRNLLLGYVKFNVKVFAWMIDKWSISPSDCDAILTKII